MAATDDEQSSDSNATNSTVELEISQTPPRMTLRSHSHPTDGASESDSNKSTDGGKVPPAKATDGTETEAVVDPEVTEAEPKRRQRKQHRKKSKAKSTFQLPMQCSMRRDQVDKRCRTLNITYKRRVCS